ncbi:hypothetical protein N431DRAFT_483480 [Stipitochalara longipes BDJ]|nr:hypothetical protein N431DRAFT_483480 [Stipitochalara longipes BDJ]
MMGDIYSNAFSIFAWLGRGPPDIDTVVWVNDQVLPALMERRPADSPLADFLQDMDWGKATEDDWWLANTGLKPHKHDWVTCWDLFLQFIQRTRWFRRCWIMQEFCLAQNCICICNTVAFRANFVLLIYMRSLIGTVESTRKRLYGLGPTLKLFELHMHINQWAVRPGSLTEHLSGYLDSSGIISPVQHACAYLGLFLDWARSRETSVQLDRVYSFIGVMKRLLGSSATFALITPRPNRPLANAFIWAATVILENRPDLRLLSFVEPRKIAKLEGLPSWVPNFSTSLPFDFPIIELTSSFGIDATLVENTRSKPPGLYIRGKTLTLSARQIGKVRECIDPILCLAVVLAAVDSGDETWLAELLPNVEGITFSTVVSAMRVFLTFVSEVRLTARDRQRMERERKNFKKRRKHAKALCKSFKDFWEAGALANENLDLEPTSTNPALALGIFNQYGVLERQELLASRSSFVTWNGYAGYGPTTMEQGDTVWLFQGGKVPFILRKNPSLKHFTLVGECLVFGVMRGELMTDEFRAGFRIAKTLFPEYFKYQHLIICLRQVNVTLTNANDKTLTSTLMKLKMWQGEKKSKAEKVWRRVFRQLEISFKDLGRWKAHQNARVENIMRPLRITKNRRDLIDDQMRDLQLRFGRPPKPLNIELDWEHDEGDRAEYSKASDTQQIFGGGEDIEEGKKEIRYLRNCLTLGAALNKALKEQLRCHCGHCGWDEQEFGG